MKVAYTVEPSDVMSQMDGLARHSLIRKFQKFFEVFFFLFGPLLVVISIPERRLSSIGVAVTLAMVGVVFRYGRCAKDAAIERAVTQSVNKRVEVTFEEQQVRITFDDEQAAAVPYQYLRKISRLRDGLYVWGGELFWIWLPYRALPDESGTIETIVSRWKKA